MEDLGITNIRPIVLQRPGTAISCSHKIVSIPVEVPPQSLVRVFRVEW